MGQKQTKEELEAEALNEGNRTHFRLSELKRLQHGFEKFCASEQCGNHKIQPEHLPDIFKLAKVQLPEELMRRIVDAIDRDHDGHIDFREFVTALSVLSRGNVFEKATFAFRVFDVDGNGTISKNEMRAVLSAMSKAAPHSHAHAHPDVDVDVLVDQLFAANDANADGVLSVHEFAQLVSNNPNIIEFEKVLAAGHHSSSQHVLVAYEGSAFSLRAFEQALETHRAGDVIYLCYVHPSIDHSRKPPLMSNANYELYHANVKRDAIASIEAAVKHGQAHGIEVNSIAREGPVGQTLCELIDELDIDVIVLGLHGTHDTIHAETLSPGSNALYVLTHATCSVLIVK